MRRVCAVALFLVALPAPAQPPRTAAGPAAIERTIFTLTNTFRTENRLAVFKSNAVLTRVAQGHARNMAAQETMAHELDGKGAADRVRDAGYPYAAVAENVAMNFNSADAGRGAVEQWKKSPPHRKNMMNAELTELGVGAAKSASGKWYFCQVFGRPRSAMTTVKVQVANRTAKAMAFRIEQQSYTLQPGHTGTYTHSKSSGKVKYSVSFPATESGGVSTGGGQVGFLENNAKYAFTVKNGTYAFGKEAAR